MSRNVKILIAILIFTVIGLFMTKLINSSSKNMNLSSPNPTYIPPSIVTPKPTAFIIETSSPSAKPVKKVIQSSSPSASQEE